MAKKQRTKRRQGRQRQIEKNQSQSRYLMWGVAVVVIALLGYFTFQAINSGDEASAAVVQTDTGALESLSIEDNQGHTAAEATPVTDRETRYLGPASDSATVSLAEAGQLDQPTLVWFHADW